MKKLGKKGYAWQVARAKLIKEALADGRIQIGDHGVISGICEDCKKWKALTPDHIIKRSQGGEHTKENISWLCLTCHNKTDNMPDSKKTKNKKPAWAKSHKCKKCRQVVSLIICPKCGEMFNP